MQQHVYVLLSLLLLIGSEALTATN